METNKEKKQRELIDEQKLLADFTTSFWLKDQIRAMHQRDPLDALKDAELHLQLQMQRCIILGLLKPH